jgi:DNA-binding NarL/FixJ family response regulator
MACLLIVDDDTYNARQLADVISANLPGVHETVCIQGVAEFRQLRLRCKPDLILVELLRHQSNGFTLAAALGRQSSAPVVLLTDRNIASDLIWAAARGIRHVMSRRGGQAVLVQQIHKLLSDRSAQQEADVADEQYEPALLNKSQLDELMTPSQAALLVCICNELRHLPIKPPACGMGIAANNSAPLDWLKNLFRYISDPDLRDALQELVKPVDQPREKPGTDLLLYARESLLSLLEPNAGSVLLVHCREAWLQICEMLQADLSATGHYIDGGDRHTARLTSFSNISGCMDLLNALGFVPELQEQAGAILACGDITVPDFVERMQNLLCCAAADNPLRNLTDAGGLQVLVSKTAWRDLAGLCLMLRALAEERYWLPVLRHSLRGLYGWKNKRPESDAELLIYLTLSLLNGVSLTEQCNDSSDPGLSAESAHRLRCALLGMAEDPGKDTSSHQRLSNLMVSIHKLWGWLEFCVADGQAVNNMLQRWQLVTGCLYHLVCHGVLQAGLLTRADISNLSKILTDLQGCLEQGLLPPENTVMNLAAMEITVGRRSQCGYGREHQLLAAGLHRLPKPDRILQDLINDVKQSGTVLSEITCELRMLTEGASRLGVGRVESLAKLMLDCYQQLNSQPGLLQRKSLRLALGRAHRVLCRLLDQAAAWLPLDQTGAGLSVAAVIDELFTQFDHCGDKAVGAAGEARHAAWLQCLSLNRRLRQLIRRSGNLSEYRSLMVELLQEQQAVIKPYLPYQSTE